MKRIITLSCTLFLTLMFTHLFAQQNKDAKGILNMNAPKWRAQYWIDGEGNPFEINQNDYMGKITMVLCFEHWDKRVHDKGFPVLKETYNAYKDNPDVRFVAIQTPVEGRHTNNIEKLAKTQRKYELPIPFGHDTGTVYTKFTPNMLVDYKMPGPPWVIIISKDGNVLYNDMYIDAVKANAIIRKELRGW